MPPLAANSVKETDSVGKWILVGGFVALYRLLLVNGNYDWRIGPDLHPFLQTAPGQTFLCGLFIFSLSLIVAGLCFTNAPTWITMILLLVPFEFSRPFLFFPKLTPLDYLIAISIPVLVLQSGPWTLFQRIKTTFGVSIICWLAFFLYCLVSARLLHGNPRGPLRWIGFLMLYYVAARASQEFPSWPARLCAILSWIGTAVTLHGLYQYAHIHDYTRLQGLFLQHNIFSAFLSLCLPAMVAYALRPSKIPSFVRWGFVVFSVLAFMLSYSRGAWLGMGIGSLITLGPLLLRTGLHQRQRFTILGGGALIVVVMIVAMLQRSERSPLSLSGRNRYWQAGSRIAKDHPWIGLGPGNYASHIDSYLSIEDRQLFKTDNAGKPILFWQHLHNLYLQLVIDLGLIGFALWVGGFGLLVWRALRNVHAQMASGLCVSTFLGISVIAFLVHNTVDIITVNSFDVVFAVLLGTIQFGTIERL